MFQMGARGLKKLFVFDVPNSLVCPAGDIRHELTEAPMWISLAQFSNCIQHLCSTYVADGSLTVMIFTHRLRRKWPVRGVLPLRGRIKDPADQLLMTNAHAAGKKHNVAGERREAG